MTPKAWTWQNVNKLDFIKIKYFSCSKGHHEESGKKKTYTMRENIGHHIPVSDLDPDIKWNVINQWLKR